MGQDEIYGRDLVEDHLEACLEAGLEISGINAEVMPGQWEFQVGPLSPLEVSDQLWIARWLLNRLGEDHEISVTLDPNTPNTDQGKTASAVYQWDSVQLDATTYNQ